MGLISISLVVVDEEMDLLLIVLECLQVLVSVSKRYLILRFNQQIATPIEPISSTIPSMMMDHSMNGVDELQQQPSCRYQILH